MKMMVSIQAKVFCQTNGCFSRRKNEAGLKLWIQESSKKKKLTISLSSANVHFKNLSIEKNSTFWAYQTLCPSGVSPPLQSHGGVGLVGGEPMNTHSVETGVLNRAS